MVIKEKQINSVSEVRWVGRHDPKIVVPQSLHKEVFAYEKCIFGSLTISIGDYVLVSNADSADPDAVEGCDIAKVLHLYEPRDFGGGGTPKEQYAFVQWYSRPANIPHQHFDCDNLCIDFEHEVIEENRPYSNSIPIESIVRKCCVINASTEEFAGDILHKLKLGTSCPMFVCRYKFVKVKKLYKLIPLELSDEVPIEEHNVTAKDTRRRRNPLTESAKSLSARKEASQELTETKRRRTSVCAPSALEFIDLTNFNIENKVSPIKIVGGRNVVRASVPSSSDRNKHSMSTPALERNLSPVRSVSRAASARLNLNLSLGNDTTADSDCLNYSIIQSSADKTDARSEMKIKLRVSERRTSARLSSLEKDPLVIELDDDKETAESIVLNYQRKLLEKPECVKTDNYDTPSKRTKRSSSKTPSRTPSRKSILKSATSRIADGTPRRSIQLSDIVEQRIFNENEIISTPKRSERRSIRPRGRDTQTFATCIEESTPTTKKQTKLKGAQPNIMKRQSLSNHTLKSDLQVARDRLHVCDVPKSLPCREKEFESIYTFLEGKIQDKCGGCIYVSGVPGTGKTATVTHVIRMLQQEVDHGRLQQFQFVEINGMRLTEPRQAYVHIHRQLTGKTVTWDSAHALLEKRFSTVAARRVTTVLLVDELDILCNRRQDVVYNLLDWPTKSTAQLVVVTIANTMDLPERVLMGKVTSRLGLTRLTFQPYTHKQLQEIVSARLNGSNAFKSEAVQLVARKVAAVSGDARRALDICRRATEIAENTAAELGKDIVNISHVQQALGEMIASAKVQAIKNCSRVEQLFLQAVVAEISRTGVEETSFLGVYTQMETIAAFMGVMLPVPGQALRTCSKLCSERLLICEHSRNDIYQKIILNVSMDDIHYALKVSSSISQI